jgi:hypothetical protein
MVLRLYSMYTAVRACFCFYLHSLVELAAVIRNQEKINTYSKLNGSEKAFNVNFFVYIQVWIVVDSI